VLTFECFLGLNIAEVHGELA